jgi:hypothetical protein
VLSVKSDTFWVLRFAVYKDLNNVDGIKIKGIRWAGHITRKECERILEYVLNVKFHNKRPLEKPRTRWEYVVLRDTSQILGIKGWKGRAEDR